MDAITEIKSAIQRLDIKTYKPGTTVVYLAYIGVHNDEVILKYGSTKSLRSRVATHKQDYQIFDLLHFEEFDSHRDLETLFGSHPDILPHRRLHNIRGQIRQEHVALSKTLSLTQCLHVLKQIKSSLKAIIADKSEATDSNIERELLNSEIAELQHKINTEEQNHKFWSSKREEEQTLVLSKLEGEHEAKCMEFDYQLQCKSTQLQKLRPNEVTIDLNSQCDLLSSQIADLQHKLDMEKQNHKRSLLKLQNELRVEIATRDGELKSTCLELNYQLQCKLTQLQRLGPIESLQESNIDQESPASHKRIEQFIQEYYEKSMDSEKYILHRDFVAHYKQVVPNCPPRPPFKQVLMKMGYSSYKHCGRVGHLNGNTGYKGLKRRDLQNATTV